MPAIASVFVEVLPETSQIADGIRRAFREVDPSVREAGSRWGREIEQGIGRPKVELQADTAKARAEIDAAARDRKATVEVDADTLGSSVERGISQGGQAGISALQPALLGVGATMLAGIASALSGLAGLVPAGLAGAGGLVGTLAIGLDGVKDAYDAVNKAAQSSGQDQIDKARETATAQRGLTDAVQAQAQAQRDVSTAYRDAKNNLDDLNLSLQGGKISEAQAYNNVLKARRDLARGGFKDTIDQQDAILRVQSAEQQWQESKQRNVELAQKANDANTKGVENSDQVVSAKERERKANEQVTAAQQSLSQATSKTSDTAKSAMQAMAQLSPNAQAFVNTLMAMKPAFQEFKNSIQDALFANIGPQFQQLATTYMPLLQQLMTGMASTMNQAFGQLAGFLQQPQTLAAMQQIFANIGQSFQIWSQAIQPFASAFLEVTRVGSGFLPQLAQMVVQVAQAFNQWAQSGQLGEWIQTGMTALQQLGGLVQQLLPMFMQLAPIGIATMSGLQTIFAALAPSIGPLSTAFASLITAITPLLGWIGQVVSAIVTAVAPALTTWFNAMGPVIQQMVAVFQPVLQTMQPILAQIANTLAGVMVQGIQTLLPVLVPFVAQAGQLWLALAPLLPALVQIAMSAIPAMQQALALVLPFVTKWMELLTNLLNLVIPPLAKVIEGLAKTFSERFGVIKDAVVTMWNVVKPIFDAMAAVLDKIAGPLNTVGNFLGFGDTATDKLNAARAQVGLPPVGSTAGTTIPKTGAAAAGITPIGPPFTGLPGDATLPPLATPPGRTALTPGAVWTPGPGQQPLQWVVGKGWVPLAAPAMPTTPTGPAPGNVYTGPHTEDTHGLLTPNAANLKQLIAQQFGVTDIGGYRNPDGYNEHSSGEALDIMVGANKALGDQINQFLLQNADALGVQYDLWQQAQWNPNGTSSPMEDRGGATANHRDHVHVRVRPGAGASGATTMSQMASPTMPAPTMPTSPTGTPPVGTAQDPMYVALPPSQQNQQQGGPGQQLGQDFLSGLGQIAGIDGSVFKDPTSFGLFKIFKGIMGLKPAGGDGSSVSGGGGGGNLIGGLLSSIIPQPFGNLQPGSPKDAPGQFMPLMPGSGGGGAINFPQIATGPPGAPGPGNQVDASINFNGPVYGSPQPAMNAATDANVPRMRQGVRPLP